jgi:acyl-coenzyme A synthetase/AMP-(fatty) acid ligase
MDPHGTPLPPRQLGEIAVRGAMSLGEYWRMPDQTAAAFFPGGWFRSSDLGILDEDGYLYFIGRATDTIRTQAGHVHPHRVEDALFHHEAVANCAVVGLGEPGDQQVVAAVQLKPGWSGTAGLAGTILGAVRTQLAQHESPARIFFVAELPTVLGGAKVQREVLRDRLTAIAAEDPLG